MEKVPLSECCEYTNEKLVAKSIKKLPKIGEGFYGLAIQGVFGLDNKKQFKETPAKRYANNLKMGIKGLYFWIINDHLYVSNEDTESVNMFAYFSEDIPNNLLYSPNCDCKPKPHIEDLCTNPLDKPLYFPLDRIDDVKKIVYDKLLKTYFNVPSEENKTQDDKNDTTK